MARMITILLTCLAFGLVFAHISNEDIKKRQVEIESKHRFLVSNFSSHSMNYFAQQMRTQNFLSDYRQSFPNAVASEVAFNWTAYLDFCDQYLDDPFRYNPYRRELIKSRGLFYAVMEEIDTGNSTASGSKARNLVEHLIYVETTVFDWNTVRALEVMLEEITKSAVGIREFFQLENEAYERINFLLASNQREEANKLTDALRDFTWTGYDLHKALPIDSEERIRKYYAEALKHYQTFKVLNNLVQANKL